MSVSWGGRTRIEPANRLSPAHRFRSSGTVVLPGVVWCRPVPSSPGQRASSCRPVPSCGVWSCPGCLQCVCKQAKQRAVTFVRRTPASPLQTASSRDRDRISAAHAFSFIRGPKEPPIPDAGIRRDDPGPGRIGLDLPPELTDEDPQDVDVARVPGPPDVLKQPVVGKQLPRVPG